MCPLIRSGVFAAQKGAALRSPLSPGTANWNLGSMHTKGTALVAVGKYSENTQQSIIAEVPVQKRFTAKATPT